MPQDPAAKVPATSRRAGAVVHLLAASGVKVPVTLKITAKEDSLNGRITHVVQVRLHGNDRQDYCFALNSAAFAVVDNTILQTCGMARNSLCSTTCG